MTRYELRGRLCFRFQWNHIMNLLVESEEGVMIQMTSIEPA